MRRQDGFTLIELMVSSAILLVITMGMTQAFTVQQQTYIVVDSLAEAQQNLRAITELVERDVRRAGYLVAEPGAVCGFDSTVASDTLYVSNTDAIDTVSNLELNDPDDSDVSGGFGAPVNIVALGTVLSGTTNVTLSQNFVDVAANGADFFLGQGIILVDKNDPNGRVACGLITTAVPAVAPFTFTVNLGATQVGPTVAASEVVAIPAHVYQIVQPAGSPLQLVRDGVLLAEDVEDMQISYHFDLNQDGNVDPGERFGSNGGPTQPFEIVAPPDAKLLREVRVNLVTVTRDDDPTADLTSLKGMGQARENRTQGSLVAADGRRRRVHSASVRLRNV